MTRKIADAFDRGKAFIPFVTAGDPDLDTTKNLILGMQEAGADLIEIGIPFSDPIAEGIVIQEADIRALSSGTTTDKIFEMVESIKNEVLIPLVFMTYINVVYKYGPDKFLKKCVDCGVSGIIIPDCPYEEKDELLPYCKKWDVDLVSFIAPTSNDRIRMIAKEAEGFLYIVSSMGVTGVRGDITTDIGAMTKIVRESTDIPCAIGFGIATPDQARNMASYADGVIVGSAIVKIIAEYGKDSVKPVCDYVRTMKDALRNIS